MYSVFIVESNDILRRCFREILKAYIPSLVIEDAADGAEALRMINKHPPDIIFMDIRLNGSNGLHITSEIKRRHPGTIIVLLGGYDLPEYRKIARERGADFFLLKDSLSGAKIADLIKSVLPARVAGF